MYLENSQLLDVVEETTILELKIQSDLRWSSNADYMCKKAFNRVWKIRRLKSLDPSKSDVCSFGACSSSLDLWSDIQPTCTD